MRRIGVAAALVSLLAAYGWAMADRADAAASVVRVMPMGDSITWGAADPSENGYRAVLKARLATAGVTIDFVGSQASGRGDSQHEGHRGFTIGQLQAGAAGWVRTYRPDVVLLLAGTNDIARRVGVGGEGARLELLIRTIKAARPGVRVIVSSIPQMAVFDTARITSWSAYRGAVKLAAVHTGSGYASGDLAVLRAQLAAGDALHPSVCGYQRLAFTWYLGWTTAFPAPVGRVWESGPLPTC